MSSLFRAQSGFYMPEPTSTVSSHVDALFNFVHGISLFFFLLIVGLMMYFVIRYRRRTEADVTPRITHNTALEIFWSAVPLALVIVIFVRGFLGYLDMRVAPNNAMTIYVTARQWAWQFTYPDGTVSLSDLAVPVDQPVRLVMSSQDVIHSLYIPNFRVKMDVLPNRYTTMWFQATQEGEFPLYCTEYCGTSHSTMTGTVKVLSRQAFDEWLLTGGVDAAGMTPAEYGAALFRRFQCHTCHSVDGSRGQGPTLKGIWGHEVRFTDGTSTVVDENYVRESILNPTAKIVEGFPPIMFSFQGTIRDEAQLNALIEYIKSLQ